MRKSSEFSLVFCLPRKPGCKEYPAKTETIRELIFGQAKRFQTAQLCSGKPQKFQQVFQRFDRSKTQ